MDNYIRSGRKKYIRNYSHQQVDAFKMLLTFLVEMQLFFSN